MMAWFRLRWVKFVLVAMLSFGVSWVVAERTSPSASPSRNSESQLGPNASGCDRSYPTLCLPEQDRDWNCDDLDQESFPVLPPDQYQLDADGDGVGCE